MWAFNFAFQLYAPLRSTASLKKYYHAVVWSFSLITAIVSVAGQSHG